MSNIIEFDEELSNAFDINEMSWDDPEEVLKELIYELTNLCNDGILSSDNDPDELVKNLIKEIV